MTDESTTEETEAAEDTEPTLAEQTMEIAETFGLLIDVEEDEEGVAYFTIKDGQGKEAPLELSGEMGEDEIFDAIVEADKAFRAPPPKPAESEYDDDPAPAHKGGRPAKAEKKLLIDRMRKPNEITYYLFIDDAQEQAKAEGVLEEHGIPHDDKTHRRVRELRVDRLDDRHVVIPVLRDANNDRARYIENDDAATAAGVVHWKISHGGKKICKPVVCARFWTQTATEYDDGQIDVPKFLSALGSSCIPATLKWDEQRKIVRLRYA